MRVGVIDIGYNAIRAAIYDSNTMGAREIFNYKFKNDILTLLNYENINIKHQTYLYIEYLLHIFKQMNVTQRRAVATAALRGQARAEEFISLVYDKYNLNIEVISGDNEAQLMSEGLISASPYAKGLAVDLGGGSLELASIENGVATKLASMDVGTKMILKNNLQDENELANIINQHFPARKYENLYLVGGALRYICRHYTEIMRYPLKNLHNLSITHSDIISYINIVTRSKFISNDSFKKKINPQAILVVKALLQLYEPEHIIASIYGLKEGVRYNMLSKEERAKDIILQKLMQNFSSTEDACQNKFLAAAESYLNILESININITPETKNIIAYSLIILSHKTHYDSSVPPTVLFEQILATQAPLKHTHRVQIAMIIFHASGFKPSSALISLSKNLLCRNQNTLSQIIGHLLKIAIDIDGPEFHKPSFSLIEINKYIEIETSSIMPKVIFDKIKDRLKLIAFCKRNSEKNM